MPDRVWSGRQHFDDDGDIGVGEYGTDSDCYWAGHCSDGHPYMHFTAFDTERSYDILRVCKLMRGQTYTYLSIAI